MFQKHKLLFFTGLILIFVLIGIILRVSVRNESSQNAIISDFIKCEQAGFEVTKESPRQCRTPDGKVFIEENISGSPTEGQIGIKGEIACLPKKGSGPQTMECAIGLLGQDGKYYALENLADFDSDYKYSQNGKKVDIYGNLTIKNIAGPDGNEYDVAGSIRIDNITEDIIE